MKTRTKKTLIRLGLDDSDAIEVSRYTEADVLGEGLTVQLLALTAGSIESVSALSVDDAELIGRKLIQAAQEIRDEKASE